LVSCSFIPKGGDRQAVNGKRPYPAPSWVSSCCNEAPGDAKAFGLEKLHALTLPGWRSIKESSETAPCLNALPKHVDHAALGDLALQPVAEIADGWPSVSMHIDSTACACVAFKKGKQVRQVNGVVPVVVLVAAWE